jgi:hypothetical protein
MRAVAGHRIAAFTLSVLTLAVVIAIAMPAAASARSSYQWPRVDERGYLTGCDATSGNAALCRCQLRWLERRYTYKQFTGLYLHHRKTLILALTKASLACIK